MATQGSTKKNIYIWFFAFICKEFEEQVVRAVKFKVQARLVI